MSINHICILSHIYIYIHMCILFLMNYNQPILHHHGTSPRRYRLWTLESRRCPGSSRQKSTQFEDGYSSRGKQSISIHISHVVLLADSSSESKSISPCSWLPIWGASSLGSRLKIWKLVGAADQTCQPESMLRVFRFSPKLKYLKHPVDLQNSADHLQVSQKGGSPKTIGINTEIVEWLGWYRCTTISGNLPWSFVQGLFFSQKRHHFLDLPRP